MSEHLSRHVDNDDMRHYRFDRTSGLPIGYFREPGDRARDAFLRWRWVAIAVLIVAVVALAATGSDLPNY